MKKKIVSLIAVAAIMGLAACNGGGTSSSGPSTEVSTTSETTSDITSSEDSSSYVDPVVHVDSVSVSLSSASVYVGDKPTASVTVLPENADVKTYTLHTSDPLIATIESNGEITALQAGTVVITAVATDGDISGEATLVINEKSMPVFAFDGDKEIVAAAGEEISLPTVSATDYDGSDLTASIEIEDLAEKGTISEGKFQAKIAGEHILSYYVETEDGRYQEDEVVVTVTPATAESFDVSGYNDPSIMSEYGVFKENFEKGRKSPLAAVNDSNNATYITGTSEAIAGNSLVIDMNKTAGSAANSVFLSAFNDYFKRSEQATYKVSFSYKVLTPSQNFGDVYFGLSWDGSNGMNSQFVTSGAVQNQVYNYSVSFPGTEVPATGNAYFFFFKLSGDTSDIKIAVDSFTIETVQLAQVTPVEPLAEDLAAGFTWDFETNGATASSGETVIINNLENETAKTTMSGSEYFSNNALKLVNADSHLFSGLTKNNMIEGKKLTIEIIYYAVSDGGFNLIMMGDSGNPTLAVSKEDLGSGIYKVTYSGVIMSGWRQLNIYGAGNANFEIYIGALTATLSEPDPVIEDQTPNGYKVGDNWTVSSRQWGNQDKTTIKTEAFDDNAEAIADERMGTAPTKFTFSGGNATMEWFQAGGKIENGQNYEIKLTYFVASWTPVGEGARLMYNMDNNVFLEVGSNGSSSYMSAGFHEETISWTATRTVDFFSFYAPEDVNGVVYIANVNVKLVGINN
jgi:uncharacterized protein YjdB